MLSELKNLPCPDIHEVNTKLIKETIEIIIDHLTNLINKIILTGSFLDCPT